MKTHKLPLAVLLLWGACSTSPSSDNSSGLGGGANSDNGKAFIAAIKGKLYAEAGFTTLRPVGDNGDITKDSSVERFAGAPSAKTAYYYIAAEEHTSLGIPDKTLVYGYIIDGNGFYTASPKKTPDEIAVEMGFADMGGVISGGSSSQKAEFHKRVNSPNNVDFTAKGSQKGFITP